MKQTFDWLRGHWAKFILVLFPDRNEDQQYDALPENVGRLYYSIPGKTFTGYIDKGRILKSEKYIILKPADS